MATLVDLLALLLRTTNENEDADNELGLAVKQSEDATQQWMIKRIELLLQREERALRRHVRLRLHPDKANASDEEKKERVRLFQLFENEFAETSPAAKLQQWLKLLKQGHFPCAEKNVAQEEKIRELEIELRQSLSAREELRKMAEGNLASIKNGYQRTIRNCDRKNEDLQREVQELRQKLREAQDNNKELRREKTKQDQDIRELRQRLVHEKARSDAALAAIAPIIAPAGGITPPVTRVTHAAPPRSALKRFAESTKPSTPQPPTKKTRTDDSTPAPQPTGKTLIQQLNDAGINTDDLPQSPDDTAEPLGRHMVLPLNSEMVEANRKVYDLLVDATNMSARRLVDIPAINSKALQRLRQLKACEDASSITQLGLHFAWRKSEAEYLIWSVPEPVAAARSGGDDSGRAARTNGPKPRPKPRPNGRRDPGPQKVSMIYGDLPLATWLRQYAAAHPEAANTWLPRQQLFGASVYDHSGNRKSDNYMANLFSDLIKESTGPFAGNEKSAPPGSILFHRLRRRVFYYIRI